MKQIKNILAIVGSASSNSSNLKMVELIKKMTEGDFDLTIYTSLKSLPHFDPELSKDNPPEIILNFRSAIEKADGIIICTPEYVFSIPSGLKNAIEWCISTTIFCGKPTGLITASASGKMGHKELQLIMKTAMAKFTKKSTLLIEGIKGKIDLHGNLNDQETQVLISNFIDSFKILLDKNPST